MAQVGPTRLTLPPSVRPTKRSTMGSARSRAMACSTAGSLLNWTMASNFRSGVRTCSKTTIMCLSSTAICRWASRSNTKVHRAPLVSRSDTSSDGLTIGIKRQKKGRSWIWAAFFVAMGRNRKAAGPVCANDRLGGPLRCNGIRPAARREERHPLSCDQRTCPQTRGPSGHGAYPKKGEVCFNLLTLFPIRGGGAR